MDANTKILIVEDQFVEANHLQLLLKRSGYRVTGIARSVDDAKKMIAQDRPGLVLVDIFLSGKSTGIDLAYYLKEENIAFIYLSANSNETVLNQAKATHPFGFLVKPFRERDLLVTLEIAAYHQQHGLESAIRKEVLFERQLLKIESENGNWEERFFKFTKALQPLIPFDLVMAVYKISEKNDIVTGYRRTGFSEYQKIGFEEFQNITGLKDKEIRDSQFSVNIDKDVSLYNGKAFSALCTKTAMKNIMRQSFGMHCNLTLPIPLEKGIFYFSFFSRDENMLQPEHVEICKRLQPYLTKTVKTLSVKDAQPAEKTITPRPEILKSNPFDGIIGKSPLLMRVFDHIHQVALAETTVLIAGESGTGKERIASTIHNLSSRSRNPFIKVNCAALPSTLIESELFGHEKGAFTGAADRRIGKFEQANTGTLFLDEIGEMPLELQAKILRALQEKEIERVGGKSAIPVNIRIIAATNRNLEKEVAEGRFRLDLYYRLNVFPIEMPPLRERKEDIPLLVKQFITIYNQKNGKYIENIGQDALRSLLSYKWPGNIRELENLMERSVLLARNNTIEKIPLPEIAQDFAKDSDWYLKTIEENERDHIQAVLLRCNGRIRGAGGAAEILGVPPTTLASKMQKLGIKRKNSEGSF